ncbi:hypothetical protein [Aestuariimicrobium kwangyangense]|uniref:hypothetical protein n=1 Tax=Aestuariimicrobium kwangyangense TaxID=396389 RepID=UPI00047C2BCE|nr:hypothetical protein [Aestuariimicrobium kwangyangense]
MTNEPHDSTLLSSEVTTDGLLTSLAILNVNWDTDRRSYLDNFLPFVYEAMRRKASDAHRPAGVRAHVVDLFGLDLPVHVVNQLLERGVKSGALETGSAGRGCYKFKNGAAEAEPSGMDRQQANLRRQQAHLIDNLRSYVYEKFDLTWRSEEAEQALLSHVEAHAAPLLESAQHGSPYGRGTSGASESRDFVVSSFVVHAFERDAESFAELETMVKGCMLASALYLGTPANVARDFQNTTLYLDTPICLKALGHEGDEARDAVQQTLELAVQHGATLACFSHTVSETDGVLEKVQNQLAGRTVIDARAQGVLKHYLATGLRETDAILARENLEEAVAALGVHVHDKPSHRRAVSVDEAAFEEQLQSTVGYHSRNTLLMDLDSLTAIHRLRDGRSSNRLETCRAVLITDNHKLVRASRQFFNSGQHRWPLAMVDHELAALVWIKRPAQAPDLPRRQIIADCYAALDPSDAYWNRVSEEISALRESNRLSADEVTILMGSHEAQRSIMEVTLGDPRRIDERALQRALGKAIEDLRKPVVDEAEAAITRAQEAESAEVTARFEATERQGEVEELRQRLSKLEEQQLKADENDRLRARRTAKVLGGLTLIALSVVATAGTSLVATQIAPHVPSPWLWTLRAAEVITFVATLAILMFGGSLKTWSDKAEEYVYQRLHRRSLRARGQA